MFYYPYICYPTETNRKGSAVINTSMASLGSIKRQNNNTMACTAFTNHACSVNDTDEIKSHRRTIKKSTRGSAHLANDAVLYSEAAASSKHSSAPSDLLSMASSISQTLPTSSFVSSLPTHTAPSGLNEEIKEWAELWEFVPTEARMSWIEIS